MSATPPGPAGPDKISLDAVAEDEDLRVGELRREKTRHTDFSIVRDSDEPISVEELATDAGLKANDLAKERVRGGFRLARYLLWLIGGVLLLIGLYGWLTYPNVAEITELVPEDDRKLDAYKEMRDAWFNEVKGLVELLVVALLVPLLSTLIGYIFGRQGEETEG